MVTIILCSVEEVESLHLTSVIFETTFLKTKCRHITIPQITLIIFVLTYIYGEHRLVQNVMSVIAPRSLKHFLSFRL